MKKIVTSVVITCTFVFSLLSIGSVVHKDNQAADKVNEVQLMKMDPGTLG